MTNEKSAYAHETQPVGKTVEDQERNAELLSGYDYEKYATALTGFTGQDLQRVGFIQWEPAVRTRVGPRGNYKSGFARLPDGKLVLAVCRDNNETDPARRRFLIAIYESSDAGLTWREIGQTPLFGKEPALTALPDGTLIMMAQGGYFGPGAKQDEHPIARSEDGGRTWEVSVHKGDDYPRNIIVEPDGSLLMVTAEKPDWESKGNGSPNLLLSRSTDVGKTWTASEGVVDWDYAGFGEVASIRLRDGRLLAALRRQIPGTTGEGFEDTVLTESTDEGKTWARPWQLTPTAQVHAYLTELHDGRLLCTYSNYHVPFGVSAILSADGGRTWDLDRTIRLSTSNGYYVGWAVTLELPDHSLITSYAVTSYPEEPPDRFTSEVVRWKLPIGEW
ncbi:MAG: exo-alpha-sialidase [Candidatus Latescibacteria bacterium]|nr:exo-alpha-sialidase [Candidatus Latescibacterota bacterium]